MSQLPVLETSRLRLRPFTLTDAPEVQRLAGAREIAEMTLNIPHPYPDGAAEEWISAHQPQFEAGKQAIFALTFRADHALCGAMGLSINHNNANAELGYWIGTPFWGRGYATEAGQAVVRYGFTTLGLHRIHATHLGRNPASGRVMQKLGMQYEGLLRQHVRNWNNFEDLAVYGLLRDEWAAAQP